MTADQYPTAPTIGDFMDMEEVKILLTEASVLLPDGKWRGWLLARSWCSSSTLLCIFQDL